MAQPWVTGPGAIYVAPHGATTPAFLGVCETTPTIDFNPRFTPVHSDVAGAEIPHDWIYSGKDATMSGILTVWNWTVLRDVMARPDPVAALIGVDAVGARGTLMNTEGFSYTLWIQFPYFSKAAFAPFMPGGFRFPNSFLFGPDRFDMGTKPNRIPISFKMTSKYQADGSWLLCDSNMTGIPAVPPATLS